MGFCLALMKKSNGDLTEVGWDLTWAPGRSSKLWQASARPLQGFSLGLVPWISIPGWYAANKPCISSASHRSTKNGLSFRCMFAMFIHVHPCSPSPQPWRFSMGYWALAEAQSRYWWSLQWWPPTCWIQLGSPGAVDWNTENPLANPAMSGEKPGMVKLVSPHEIWCSYCSSLLGVYTNIWSFIWSNVCIRNGV